MRAGYQAVRIKTRERTMTEIILRAEHLTKTFSTDKGGFTAVRDVSFEVKKRRSPWNRRRIRFRKDHGGASGYRAYPSYRGKNFSDGKGDLKSGRKRTEEGHTGICR